MPDWTSLLSQGSRRRGYGSGNDYIADMLVQQGADTSPIGSPFQGLARIAQAYAGKKMMERGAEDRKAGNQTLADLLAPSQTNVTNGPQQSAPLPGGGTLDYSTPQINEQADPRNAQIAELLNAGIGTETMTSRALDQLGLGKPKDPIKLGENDRLLSGDDPTKVLVDSKAKPKNFNTAFDENGNPNTAFQDYQKSLAAQRKPQVSVNVSADKAFGTQLGENAGKILDASHAAAASGVQSIAAANQIKSALDSGPVSAGPGSSVVQFVNQISGNDPQKVENTRSVIQGLAKLALGSRAKLKGTGALSDMETKMAKAADSGDISDLTVGELRLIADKAEKEARTQIGINKSNVAKARKAAPNNQDLVDFYNVDEPGPYAPPQQASPQGRVLKYNPATGRLE